MSGKVQMLAVVSRSKKKGKLEIIAFCDGARPAGVRPITAVLLSETRCLTRKIGYMENIMLTAWFNQFDRSVPVSQQALVVLIEAPGLSLDGEFEVTPLGHATMKYNNGIPVHLPTASISTRKKLYAMHWDQMRGLLRQYQEHQAEQANAEQAAQDEQLVERIEGAAEAAAEAVA